jgi:hypothetical protein
MDTICPEVRVTARSLRDFLVCIEGVPPAEGSDLASLTVNYSLEDFLQIGERYMRHCIDCAGIARGRVPERCALFDSFVLRRSLVLVSTI